MQTDILTVTRLTSRIKHFLEGTFPDVWVEGEISNLSVPQSGHAYFTLKDAQSQLRAVLFRSSLRFLKFSLEHGMHVICRGRISLYELRGEYQLVVEYIEPAGVGALQLAFEQLKAKLETEGLFEHSRKKRLPLLPARIGIITSPTGAAIRDILRVIRRRHPKMHILIYPVPVQGADATPSIIEALRYFNGERNADVVIVTRGGGSLEDLWAFNEETVARAVSASRIAVISAVGHETDYTISDFVADLRAPTPSAAAEMVVESEERLCAFIDSQQNVLVRSMRVILERFRASLREAANMLRDPRRLLERHVQRVDELTGRMMTGFSHHVRRDRALLTALTAGLAHLNPLGILSRGYSITRKASSGVVLKNAAEAAAGELITTRLHIGEILSRVEKKKEETER